MDIILTHENADFDAVASQLAASKLNAGAVPVLPVRQNRNVRLFLSLFGETLPFIATKDMPRVPIAHAILVDTQHAQTVRGMGKKTRVKVYDHHGPDPRAREGWELHIEQLGATTSLLTEMLQTAGVALSPVEATLLMLGIYEDTGSLSYGTTTPRDIQAAAWLLGSGALLDVVRGFMRHSLGEEQKQLYEQLAHGAQSYEFAGQTVVIAVAQAQESVDEIASVAHELRDVLEPSALFLLIDFGTHIQVVARSTTDAVDVGAITQRLGGGGHKRAAAAVQKGKTLEEVQTALLVLLKAGIHTGPTVADVMSNGVKTLGPATRAREAHARMRRYGYEGFPVIKDKKVIGLLTRRAVDRALDHGLEDVQVDRLMTVGSVTVRPGDTLDTLQQVMSSSGWGQVPVVGEQGEILGVVTRTDLIKHLGPHRKTADRREEIAALLDAALSPPLMAIAVEAGRRAYRMGVHLFIVGGVVRDLLLRQPLSDVDFVVEGDAVGLTRALQGDFGGEMRSHERFGTGKWLLDTGAWRAIGARLGAPVEDERLPQHLDFVTARTEFYSAPTELPEVEEGSIKHDLHRRDFTINTLAIRLDPPALGELLDFYGGERDLAEKRIRVLHSLSLIDDPTRIMRAARLEQRLAFRIDARTEELIGHALPLLDRISGDRLRHELDLIFEEAQPELTLARLDQLGILRALNPALCWPAHLAARYVALRDARDAPLWPELAALDLTLPYFGALTFDLPDEVVTALCDRLHVRRRTTQMLDRLRALRGVLPRLIADLRPSEVDEALAGSNDWVLMAAWALSDSSDVRTRIIEYAVRLRHVMPVADGGTLLARGCRAGPEFRTILQRLRSAWLDGEVRTAKQEAALLDKLIAETAHNGAQRADNQYQV